MGGGVQEPHPNKIKVPIDLYCERQKNSHNQVGPIGRERERERERKRPRKSDTKIL